MSTSDISDLLEPHLPFRLVKKNHRPDGTFPSGIPNPLLPDKRKVTADRLTALANGLGIPPEELFARATGLIAPGGRSEEEVRLLSMFKELSPDRKADVLGFVEMLHSKESSHRSSRRRSA